MNTSHHIGKIIDLPLGMERLHTTQEGVVLETLRILFETLKADLATLQEAEKKGDRAAAEAILCKIEWGLDYTGTPRLEQACDLLYDAVKRAKDLSKIGLLFGLLYDEAKLFDEEFKALTKVLEPKGMLETQSSV